MATKTDRKTTNTKPATEATKAPAKKATTHTEAKAEAKAPRTDERNGIRPPTRVGTVLSIWDHYEHEGKKLTPAGIPALAEAQGWNLALARSWFRQWRKYHGIEVARATKSTPEKKASAKKAA